MTRWPHFLPRSELLRLSIQCLQTDFVPLPNCYGRKRGLNIFGDPLMLQSHDPELARLSEFLIQVCYIQAEFHFRRGYSGSQVNSATNFLPMRTRKRSA